MQTTPARMEPCVQTVWEATTVSASRVLQESTVKKVRKRCFKVLCDHHC